MGSIDAGSIPGLVTVMNVQAELVRAYKLFHRAAPEFPVLERFLAGSQGICG